MPMTEFIYPDDPRWTGKDAKPMTEPIGTVEANSSSVLEPTGGITDAMAAAAHDAWYAEKARRLRDAGLPPSWPSETGEEQLVPWSDLSEPVRDFDRIVIGAALSATPVRPDPATGEDATVDAVLVGLDRANDALIASPVRPDPESQSATTESQFSSSPVRPDLTALVSEHTPWARSEFAAMSLWMACSCGWNAMRDNDQGTWNEHFLRVAALRAEQVEQPDLLAEFALLTEARNRMNDLLAYKQAHPVSGGIGTRIIAVADALAALVMATPPPLSDQASERRTG